MAAEAIDTKKNLFVARILETNATGEATQLQGAARKCLSTSNTQTISIQLQITPAIDFIIPNRFIVYCMKKMGKMQQI